MLIAGENGETENDEVQSDVGTCDAAVWDVAVGDIAVWLDSGTEPVVDSMGVLLDKLGGAASPVDLAAVFEHDSVSWKLKV